MTKKDIWTCNFGLRETVIISHFHYFPKVYGQNKELIYCENNQQINQ